MSVLYTAHAQASGGRTGTAHSDDGRLEVTLSTPKELGGDGGKGTNPEQLFAAGYSACFLGAMKFVAGQEKVKLPEDLSVAADVGIGPREDGGGFGAKATRRGASRGGGGDRHPRIHTRRRRSKGPIRHRRRNRRRSARRGRRGSESSVFESKSIFGIRGRRRLRVDIRGRRVRGGGCVSLPRRAGYPPCPRGRGEGCGDGDWYSRQPRQRQREPNRGRRGARGGGGCAAAIGRRRVRRFGGRAAIIDDVRGVLGRTRRARGGFRAGRRSGG